MSVDRDFNNSAQKSSGSLMEVIKQTMIKQDLMFRMQVHELHCLYWVQKFLAKDLGCGELCGHNSLSAMPQPMLSLKDATEYASLPDESKLSYTDKVTLTTCTSREVSENHKSIHNRPQRRPLDLQLSADKSVDNVMENTPKNKIMLDQSKRPTDTEHCLFNVNFLDDEEVELSLGHRAEKGKREGRTGKFIDKATQPCYQNVIDLEESVEQESRSHKNYTRYIKCASPSMYSRGDNGGVSFLSPVTSLNEKKDQFDKISEFWSAKEKNECYQEQASPSKGNKECRDDVLHNHLSTSKQQFASYQGRMLDLNVPFIDDSSWNSNTAMSENSSLVGSVTSITGPIVASIEEIMCSTPSTEKLIRCSSIASEMIPHSSKLDHASLGLDRKSKFKELFLMGKCKQIVEGGTSTGTTVPETMSISEGLGSCNTEQKIDNFDASKSGVLASSLDDSDCKLMPAGLMSSEKSATENIALSWTSRHEDEVQEGQSDKSPISLKSCCTSDNDSSNAKSIPSNLQYDAVKGHLKTSLGSECADLLPIRHDTGTANTEEVRMRSIDQSEESLEVLQRAAELLIQLSSLKNSTIDQDPCAKAGSEEIENEDAKQPQHQADSFELMVLELTEDSMDDGAVSSKPFVPNDMEVKDFSCKLRRGRRMKDFQREILPTLASLDVHEIREDINILEGVLRSREYRRTRAKMAAQGQNWSAVKRNRRSRLNNVRRRIFS